MSKELVTVAIAVIMTAANLFTLGFSILRMRGVNDASGEGSARSSPDDHEVRTVTSVR